MSAFNTKKVGVIFLLSIQPRRVKFAIYGYLCCKTDPMSIFNLLFAELPRTYHKSLKIHQFF